MGDRYQGNQYVTSQDLAERVYEENEINFLANTPGNYPNVVTAIDVDGQAEVVYGSRDPASAKVHHVHLW